MPRDLFGRRRALGYVSFAAVLAVTLAGCSGGGDADSSGGDGDEPVTLRLSVQAGAVESPYAVMAKTYAEEHPNVTFEIEEVPNEQFGEVLRTQLQGGNAPDVFYVTGGNGNPHSSLPLAEGGFLEPLTDTVAEELYTDETRVLAEYDGQIWTQPLDFVPVTSNYNLTVAEELGIDLPFGSVDDVFAACDVAADAGKSLLMLAGSTVPNNGLTTLQMAASRVYVDEPDWNDKRAAGEVTFSDSDGWRESIEVIVELYDRGCFQLGAEAGVIADNVPAVAAGNAVGGFAPGGATGDLKRLNPDNTYVSTVFPGDSEAKTKLFASPSNMLAVNASSGDAEKAAALEFLAWLAEPANADATADLSGNTSIRAGDGGQLPEQYALIEDYFTDHNYQPLANLLWPTPEIYNVLGTGVQGLLTGQTDVDSVLAAMDAAWDSAG
jgi:raffinose/stachyose/melibiose transport system substrate-binding protein